MNLNCGGAKKIKIESASYGRKKGDRRCVWTGCVKIFFEASMIDVTIKMCICMVMNSDVRSWKTSEEVLHMSSGMS